MIESHKKVVGETEHPFPNDSVKNLCLTHGKLIHAKKNSLLFSEDYLYEKPFVYYIADGVCSISGISMDGQEQTFVYQMPGEMTGHVPYLVSKDAHSILYSYRRPTVIAKTNCTLYKIPENKFLEYMESSLEFSNYLNYLLAHNYSMTLAHLKQIQEDSVVTLICRFLLQMSMETASGPIIPKLFTYNEIAKYFGLHEVTVSRIIGRLKQKGYLVRTADGLLIMNAEALRDIILHPDTFKYKSC